MLVKCTMDVRARERNTFEDRWKKKEHGNLRVPTNQLDFQLFKRVKFYIFSLSWLNSDDLWPHKCLKVTLMRPWSLRLITLQVFKWVRFYISSSSYNFTSLWSLTLIYDFWPQQHNIHRFPSCMILSLVPVGFPTFRFEWIKLDIFSSIIQLELRWPLTLVFHLDQHLNVPLMHPSDLSLVPTGIQLFKWVQILHFSEPHNLTPDEFLTLMCDLWPHGHMKLSVLHLWPKFGGGGGGNFTKIVCGCACRTPVLYTIFLSNLSPISIPFSKEKYPNLTKLDAFYNNLPKIHPIYVIWAPLTQIARPLYKISQKSAPKGMQAHIRIPCQCENTPTQIWLKSSESRTRYSQL